MHVGRGIGVSNLIDKERLAQLRIGERQSRQKPFYHTKILILSFTWADLAAFHKYILFLLCGA